MPLLAVVGPLGDDPLDQLGPDVPIGYDTNTADLKTARDPQAQPDQRGVTFTLGPQNLGFYNEQEWFVVQPGPFDLRVGDSSVGTGLTGPALHTTFTLR